jgi:hypothetical protein
MPFHRENETFLIESPPGNLLIAHLLKRAMSINSGKGNLERKSIGEEDIKDGRRTDKETFLPGSFFDVVDFSCDVCRGGLGISLSRGGRVLESIPGGHHQYPYRHWINSDDVSTFGQSKI